MSGSYYFLCASLPYLQFGAPPAMDTETFLAACAQHVPPRLYAELESLTLLPRDKAASAAEAEWNAFERALRVALARLRATRAGTDPAIWGEVDPGTYGGLDRLVTDAYANRHPLATEDLLDRRRWAMLDELENGRIFTYDFLVIYRLRLLLLDKWRTYDAAAGRQALKTFLDIKLKSFKLPEFADAS